ncbi:unnamed protein product [Caenorhabditis angaria]|uniref:Uncharacterized protein n=1 Tax=Caenorhabditis angaria TaxID=860376 RepID=A0A9P1IVR5_9PELO|nr:unnamed protein product [Caenorhabditis angaria]
MFSASSPTVLRMIYSVSPSRKNVLEAENGKPADNWRRKFSSLESEKCKKAPSGEPMENCRRNYGKLSDNRRRTLGEPPAVGWISESFPPVPQPISLIINYQVVTKCMTREMLERSAPIVVGGISAAAAVVDKNGATNAAGGGNGGVRKKSQDTRTCCNLCHIKFGAAFLGFFEALIAFFVLLGAGQQIIWKNKSSTSCDRDIFRDCLIFQFNHFNVTLIFDYIVVLMMVFIIFSVICLFCGVFSDTSCLILPHIVIQAIFLLFSLGYFILYAWSYFYGDLVTHKRPFQLQSMFERMWLATLLLTLAGLQSYLFSSVIRCSLYLADLEESRRRRESAFERCSERVRIAKENGLWRTTSWGGGFQQYKGQYDKPKKEVKNKGFHVQWNTDVEAAKPRKESIELAAIDTVEVPPLSPIPEDEVKEIVTVKTVRKVSTSTSRSEERRSSTLSSKDQNPGIRGASESPKKEKEKPRSVKKTASEGTSRMEEEMRRMSRDSIGKSHHHHHHHHIIQQQTSSIKDSPSSPKRHVKLKPSESSIEPRSQSARRPSLKKNKSVDSGGDQFDEVVAFYKEKPHRRRSSDHGHHGKSSKSPDKKDIPIVKKVSITASSAPFV